MTHRAVENAGSSWAEELAERLALQRERLQAAIGVQRSKVQQCEIDLQRHLATIEQGMQAAAQEGERRDAEILQKLSLLKSEQEFSQAIEADLHQRREDLDHVRAGLEALQQAQLQQQQSFFAQVTQSLAELREREASLSRQFGELAAAQATLEAERHACEAMQAAVVERERRLELREAELRETAQSQLSEATSAATDDSKLLLQLSEARLEIEMLQENRIAQARREQILEANLQESNLELQQLGQELKDALIDAASSVPPADRDDLRQRLDMALADVRELKGKNAELSEQLSRAKTSSPAIVLQATGGDDWESRKQRMLAQLESDFDVDDSQQKADRLTIEEAIRSTEQMLAAKNEEIQELRRLLSEQSGNIGGVAIGAAAIADLFDTDELVCQEREHLRELQERLREQLKQAEIDISMERAKIARERAILEEQTRQFEQRQQQPSASGESSANGKASSNGGRWLQRLGLREEKKK